jgi:hypothetical protein
MKNFLITTLLISLFYLPASAGVAILNGLTHTHSLVQGQKTTGKVQIRNESAKPARVIIYKQDLIAVCGQEVNYLNPNGFEHSLSPYLTTTVDEKLLGPNEEYVLFYTIELSSEQQLKGSFWSVLMIEGADPIKEDKSEGLKINSVMRYAIQIIGDVGTEESTKLGFEDIKVKTIENESQIVTLRLKNEGFFSNKVKVILEIYNQEGEKIKTLEGTSKRIYPQGCNEFEIELKGIKKGKYEGILIADNSKDLFGANLSLEIN